MAIVQDKVYHAGDSEAAFRTNDYIADGHGAGETERTNRYITDGHGGETPTASHNCPADPQLASAYMQVLRADYERKNSHRAVIRGDSERKDITHVQYFISFAEHEDVPLDEMMAMAKELIERTHLKDFACLYAAHTNTWRPEDIENPGNKHIHLSVCPYPLPGNKNKLPYINKAKWDLQREMDKICVEHGYSIIQKRKLMANEEYYKWFSEVEKSGKVTIHQQEKKSRRQRYQESEQRNLRSRSRAIRRSYNLLRKLDIRNTEELAMHIKSVGSDICELKKDIARQGRLLDQLSPVLAVVESAEGKYTPAAQNALKRLGCASERDVQAVRYRAAKAEARLKKDEEILIERKKEYGQLKKATNNMDEELWAELADGNPYPDYDSDIERAKRAVAEADAFAAQEDERLRRVKAEDEKKNWHTIPHWLSTRSRRPYRVPRFWASDGQPVTPVEMSMLLAIVVIRGEGALWLPSTIPPSKRRDVCYAKPDRKVQAMLDAIETARREDIKRPIDLVNRLTDAGAAISAARALEDLQEARSRYARLKHLEQGIRLAQSAAFCYGPLHQREREKGQER